MLYFLPGNQSPDKSLIAKFGLEYAFENLPYDCGQVKTNQGPDGQSGFVVSCSGLAPDYRPDHQVWFKHPLGSHFGWSKFAPPTPAQLQRQLIIPGQLVRLVDDNDWLIPIAHSWTFENQRLCYHERYTRTLEFVDGAWKPGKIVAAQEAFATIGKSVFDAWRQSIESNDGSFVIPDTTNLCCKTICLNYRLSAVEVGALGLLTNDANYAWSILRILIDMDGYLDLQKKIIDARSTSFGSEASSAATE